MPTENWLASENSPYLLQHATNPVPWYPWGPVALERARAENKPIFLSIGYSACHWCHVMAHESFEDPRIAEILRQGFISIKVDREERPELDHLYMQAVQIMTGRGGWPLSVFLTPELEPFYGGTYWPPRSRHGLPGFDQVLQAVTEAWQHRQSDVRQQGQQLIQTLTESMPLPGTMAALDDRPLAIAQAALHQAFDPQEGGFGSAPKFPPALSLRLLLRRWLRSKDSQALSMVRTTLDHMAAGGMYDQLGGGFHRYSVDSRWLVPHFEKMLYDNAALAECYLEAWQATGHEPYARIVRETLDYVLRDMTDPQGGFYSAEDADSQGHEGQFYLWTPEEVAALLGPQHAAAFSAFYDVTRQGNFEGRNILHCEPNAAQTGLTADLIADRARLLAARSQRVRPACDDKVLVSWNGLMIAALARAGVALDEPRYTEAAARAARFLLDHLRDPRGHLFHYWRRGRAQGAAYLDDYAALANALVGLYEAGRHESWIDEAVALTDQILQRFADPDASGFFYASHDHQPLPVRHKDLFDSAVPSATGLAVTLLLRLGRLCQRSDYLAAAEETLHAHRSLLERAPQAMGQMLLALDLHLGPVQEVVILADHEPTAQALQHEFHRRFLPHAILALRCVDSTADQQRPVLRHAFQGKQLSGQDAALFLCQGFACQAPVVGFQEAAAALDRLASD